MLVEPSIAMIAIAIVVSAIVSYASSVVLARQRKVAQQLQQSAGIWHIEQVEESAMSLARVLSLIQPKSRLRILTVTGASVLRAGVLEEMLGRGVNVDILILDPSRDTKILRDHGWLKSELESTLKVLERIEHLSSYHEGRLSVRLYSQPVLEILMFVDEDSLFISSYLPLTRSQRLIYQIRRGEKSLYRLYEDGFQYLWGEAESMEGMNRMAV